MLAGGALMCLGVLVPIVIRLPIVASLGYFARGLGDGIILLISGGALMVIAGGLMTSSHFRMQAPEEQDTFDADEALARHLKESNDEALARYLKSKKASQGYSVKTGNAGASSAGFDRHNRRASS